MDNINKLLVVNKSLKQQNFLEEFLMFWEDFLWNPEDIKDEIVDTKMDEFDSFIINKWVPLFRIEIDNFRQNIATYLSDFHQKIQFAFRAQVKKEMLVELKNIEKNFKRFNDDGYVVIHVILWWIMKSDINSMQDIYFKSLTSYGISSTRKMRRTHQNRMNLWSKKTELDILIEKIEIIEKKIEAACTYRENIIRAVNKNQADSHDTTKHISIKKIIETSSKAIDVPRRASMKDKVDKMRFRVETIISWGILHQQAKIDLANMISRLNSHMDTFSGELLLTVISLKEKIEWTLESLEDKESNTTQINISNETRISNQEIQTYSINILIIKQLELLIKQTPAKQLSSTRKNSHISVGDGTFIEKIFHNFLLSLMYVLKNNYILVWNTSWADIITAINSHINSTHFSEKIAFYSRLSWIQGNIESFSSILEWIIKTLENFSLENHWIGHFRASWNKIPLLNLISSLKLVQSSDISEA